MQHLILFLFFCFFINFKAYSDDRSDIIFIDESFIDLYYKFENSDDYYRFLNNNGIREGVSQAINYRSIQRIFTDLPNHRLIPGGSGANSAIAADKNGAKVAVIALIGDNKFSKLYTSSLTGLNNHLIMRNNFEPPILGLIISPEGNRTMLAFPGDTRKFTKEDFPMDEIKKYKILKISGYLLNVSEDNQQVYQWLFEECKKNNIKIAVTLPNSPYITEKISNFIYNNLENISYMIGNISDFNILFSVDTIKELPQLLELPPTFILTIGERGMFAIDNKNIIYHKAFKPEKVIDVTGARDAFAGGFLAVAAHDNYNMKKALCWGAATATIVVATEGGRMLREQSTIEHNQNLCGKI